MNRKSLDSIQKLVLDVLMVERNHSIPGTHRHENVIEHSFAIAMLSWKLFDMVRPPIRLEKILKYALIHDFLERGQKNDVNTYASPSEREAKKVREEAELAKLTADLADFDEFTTLLHQYDERADEESLFVWTTDKMQQIILAQMDNWRPYAGYGITYEAYVEKNEEILRTCSPYLRDIFETVFTESKETYYDNPAVKSARS